MGRFRYPYGRGEMQPLWDRMLRGDRAALAELAALQADNERALEDYLATLGGGANRIRSLFYTGGDINVSVTSWTDVSTGLDIVIPAAVGDWVAYHLSMFITPTGGTDTAVFNVVARTSAGQQGSWGAAETATSSGVAGWYASSGAGSDPHIGGSVARQVTAADLENGLLTLRFRCRMTAAGTRTIKANADLPFQAYAVNHGIAA